MKKTYKFFLQYFIILALASFCFAIPGFLKDSKICKPDHKTLTQRIQSVTREKQAGLNNYLKKFKKDYYNRSAELIGQYNQNLYNKEGFAFYVYNKDSLEFWSINTIPIDQQPLYSDHGAIKLKNGWYLSQKEAFGKMTFIGLYLVKRSYKYSNKYLQNDFEHSFPKDIQCRLSKNKGKHFIKGKEGNFLFSIQYPEDENINVNQSLKYFIYFLFLTGTILLIVFLYKTRNKLAEKYNRNYINALFILIIILLRYLSFVFEFPQLVYDSKIFQPVYYATSDYLPSLGDFIVNVVLAFYISLFIFKWLKNRLSLKTRSVLLNSFIATILLTLIFVLSSYCLDLFEGLVLNSNIVFSIDNIFSLDILSFLGFFSMALIIFSHFLLSYILVQIASNLFNRYLGLLISFVIALGIFLLLDVLYFRENIIYLVPFFVVTGLLIYRVFQEKNVFTFPLIAFYIFIYTIFSTIALNSLKDYKEKEYRKILAYDLSSEKDPIAESIFLEIEQQVKKDEYLKQLLKDYPGKQEEINKQIERHFKGYWYKYDVFITLCTENESLIIKPSYIETNCFDFFEEMIKDDGQHTMSGNLYYLDNNTGRNSYLAVFKMRNDTLELPAIFIELNSKYAPKDLGYPELLIDERTMKPGQFTDYSYAKYEQGELYTNYGKYFYSLNLKKELKEGSETFFDRNGYNHLLYKPDDDTTIIISKKNESLLSIISPFSYLFIIHTLIVFLVISIVMKIPGKINFQMNLKARIQSSIVIILLLSFMIIGMGSVLYIINIYEKKNFTQISEKMHSILIELEHKLSHEEELTPEMSEYLTDLLIKFQNVFFTDINIYDLDGDLLASSRPKVFTEGLTSTKMNAEAFHRMNDRKQFLYLHEEKIGNLEYLSAYVPFRNNRNKHIAYLNLPYFAKQNELQEEIASFMVTFINIYLLLIAISLVIAVLISSHITKPLQLIREKLGRVIYGRSNEKIQWKRNDEIGKLINEYNRMVDELENSAKLLAKSERESAWREMAKQVAHEIKNPLTPMKLNIQYLYKAWKDKAPDWEDRLKTFTNSLIEQIDTLSKIATEFSDFAKMPITHKNKVDIVPLIKNVVDLYNDKENVVIEIENKAGTQLLIYADREQLLRVFNNLITNSLQAKRPNIKCVIYIIIEKEQNFCKISIIDNGKGIPGNQQEKIFSPSFTTKSSGMGLGLAMVKNIVEITGGRIEFESDVNVGTSFYIWLPVYKV